MTSCKDFLVKTLDRCNYGHLQVLGYTLLNIRKYCKVMPFNKTYRCIYGEWNRIDFLKYLDEVEKCDDDFTKIEVNIAFLTILNTMNLMTEYFYIKSKNLE